MKNIVKEKKTIDPEEHFVSPGKRYKKSRQKIITNDFDRDAI